MPNQVVLTVAVLKPVQQQYSRIAVPYRMLQQRYNTGTPRGHLLLYVNNPWFLQSWVLNFLPVSIDGFLVKAIGGCCVGPFPQLLRVAMLSCFARSGPGTHLLGEHRHVGGMLRLRVHRREAG